MTTPLGLTLIDLVEALSKHGYNKLADLQKIPPNPMLWNRNQWLFAVSVIAKGYGISEKDVRTKFDTAGKLLEAFNNVLRKTGLLIELQEVKKLSEARHLKALADVPLNDKWDFEFVNEELKKK